MNDFVQQLDLFNSVKQEYKITKPIRLIELFAGIGAQAKALELLGADFEHWKICEWAIPSIKAYNSIHLKDTTDYSQGKTLEEMIQRIDGVSSNYNEPIPTERLKKLPIDKIKDIYNNCVATHNLINIMNVHGKDFEIKDTDKYEYIVTYSFPCQDLSLAGKRAGMSVSQAEGGTRSGLLWEVERILDELSREREREHSSLPQILLMENVPEVMGSGNVYFFNRWLDKLESLGYSNFFKILNAKHYGVPQNRKRCYMISLLGEWAYEFPDKQKLKLKLKDLLEDQVDEKYYLSQKMINCFLSDGTSGYPRKERFLSNIGKGNKEIGNTITTKAGNRVSDNFIFDDPKVNVLGNYMPSGHNAASVVDPDGLSPTVMENHGTVTAIPIKNANSKGYLMAEEGDGIDISTRMQYHRGTVQKDSCQTITTMGGENVGVVVNDKESVFTDVEKELFTDDGNIKRYIGSEKIDEFKEGQMATTTFPNGYGHGPRTHNESITLNTIDKPVVKKNLRIRKLTPKECVRLMSFEDKDYDAMREINMSDAQIFHVCGDSIIVSVLKAIFKQLL